MITELLYAGQIIYARTYQTIQLLIVVSIWYLICTTVLSVGQYYLERYYARGTRQGQAPSFLDVCGRGIARLVGPLAR